MYLEEKMDLILETLERIEKKLDRLELQGVMTVSDIATYTGVSKNTLYTSKRYLLPNFGEAAEGCTKLEWTKQEVMAWLDRGTDSLRRAYERKKRG